MSEKIILFICFMGICQAIFIDTHKQNKESYGNEESKVWQLVNVYHPPRSHISQYKYETHAYPKYDFEYAVSDKKTGDHKQHRESRDGDHVHGEYSLVEPDGSLRKVQYNADDHNGFNAIVSKGIQKHGDHAVSVFDHTRHFYPIGHNVKINHYFPSKPDSKIEDSQLESTKEEKEPTPVQEEQESLPRNDDVMVLHNSGEKVVLLEPMKGTDLNKESSLNAKSEDAPSFNPPTDTLRNLSEADNHKAEIATVSVPSDVEKVAELNKEDNKLSDSEVASSYYHSRVYYLY